MSVFLFVQKLIVNDLENHYNNVATYSKFNEHSDVMPGISDELFRRDKNVIQRKNC